MTVKIGFFTDTHLRATRPASRTDADFFGTQLAKIDSARKIFEGRGVDIVIHGGDVVDSGNVANSVIIRASATFRKFKTPVYSLAGNHDAGYHSNQLGTSALGVMFESRALTKLETLRVPGVVIRGVHAQDDTNWGIADTSGNDEVPVLVAHKMLTTMPIPGGNCYLVDDVDRETNCGVILSGDIHSPHCLRTESGRWFVNPGSLSRMSVNDRGRRPQVAVITIEGYDVSVELIPVESRPGSEVFDEAAYAERLAAEAHGREFVRSYVGDIISAQGKVAEIGPSLLAYAAGHAGDNPAVTRVLKSALARAEAAVMKESEE